MSYQDRWVRGQTTQAGDRACAERYALLRPVMAEYTRQSTVWDIGANLGYFGCRLAEDFGCVSVMVDQRLVLADVCRENGLPTTIAMTHSLSAQDLAEIAASEHADVVLALNVLHHIEDWQPALAALLSLGDVVVLETPGRGDVNSAHYDRSQEILDVIEWLHDVTLLGTTPSHVTPGVQRPMYRLSHPKTSVVAGYAYGARVRVRGAHPARRHVIDSTPHSKQIEYVGGESRPWVQGMNLWNWLQFGGSYPARTQVQTAAEAAMRAVQGFHGDLRPWNLILQGQSVQVIDQGHRASIADTLGLVQTLEWIANPELAYAR